MSNTTATTISNKQTSETSNVGTLRDNQKNENSSNEAAGSVQNVTSNTESNVSAENKAPSTENATLKSNTPEVSAPAESNANKSAAPATSTPTGYRNAAGTVNPDNINNQPAKENQELANKTNLTSSDNYSSNIYEGTDGKYYKIVTIYGDDYVYRTADIQANGTTRLRYLIGTAEDTKNNINISKEDLGNGKTRWTVTFFPNKGLQNYGGTLHGLSSAKFGIALTSDYQIVGNVDMEVISDPNQTFLSHTYKPGSNRSTDIPVQNPPAEVKFSFNPNTDVDPDTGLINSKTMPAYNNKYLQGSYYFTTATNTGAKNLWQTYFFNHHNDVKYYNAYDGSPYLGGGHDFHLNNFEIKNKTGVDGAKFGDKIIYDKLGYRLNSKNGVANSNGVVNSDNFNQAMEFKSQGSTGNSQTQFSSYVISFTTQHTDSHEVELATGWKNQQFSGISANIYSYQNTGYYNMFSRLYGEQRALTPADAADPYAPLNPKDIIPNWGPTNDAMKNIHTDYLNNAQINVLRNKIQNNITDPDAVNNIIKEGNSLNDAMKKLGNSIGQYDSDGKFTDHKVDTTKASGRYKYADSKKKSAYDTATDAVSNIISVENGTVNRSKGTYADPSHLTETEKDKVKKNVEDANKGKFPDGTKVDVGDDGTATITYPDKTKSTDTIPGSKLVSQETDAEKITPSIPETKVPVADPSRLTDSEKDQVKTNVTDANKDNLPSGSQITVGNDGTTTVTYPDGSKDTVPGDKVVEGKSDADNNEPKVPGDKVKVDNPNKLTDSEKEELSNNLEKLNPGTVVTIADDGTATLTYPDGSTNVIAGSQLVVSKDNVMSVVTVPTSANKIDKNNYSLGKKGINNSTNKLPQTGENNNSQKLSIIGMTLMGILGLFGLDRKKKKN